MGLLGGLNLNAIGVRVSINLCSTIGDAVCGAVDLLLLSVGGARSALGREFRNIGRQRGTIGTVGLSMTIDAVHGAAIGLVAIIAVYGELTVGSVESLRVNWVVVGHVRMGHQGVAVVLVHVDRALVMLDAIVALSRGVDELIPLLNTSNAVAAVLHASHQLNLGALQASKSDHVRVSRQRLNALEVHDDVQVDVTLRVHAPPQVLVLEQVVKREVIAELTSEQGKNVLLLVIELLGRHNGHGLHRGISIPIRRLDIVAASVSATAAVKVTGRRVASRVTVGLRHAIAHGSIARVGVLAGVHVTGECLSIGSKPSVSATVCTGVTATSTVVTLLRLGSMMMRVVLGSSRCERLAGRVGASLRSLLGGLGRLRQVLAVRLSSLGRLIDAIHLY
ncbi:hypothetical protein BJ166DRAFT_1136 [Pestalotiopsis sp. NC0098]|nr:hypothetical protein BJ166DRAFT_1136 [Pestalotiopsis sp. NC0098]